MNKRKGKASTIEQQLYSIILSRHHDVLVILQSNLLSSSSVILPSASVGEADILSDRRAIMPSSKISPNSLQVFPVKCVIVPHPCPNVPKKRYKQPSAEKAC
jgi:hypothetical protein